MNPIVEKLHAAAAVLARDYAYDQSSVCTEAADEIARLTAPVEGVEYETTAEERANMTKWYRPEVREARIVRDFDRQAAHIAILLAALAAEKERADAADESGWVIEGAWSEVSAPSYWCGSSAWSEDHMRALRFAREDDAKQAAFFMLDGMNIRVCEHAWSKS